MTAAIVVAAGSSRRMGFDKLTADLAGRPVLVHSVEAFLSHPEIDHVVVVAPADEPDRFAEWFPRAQTIPGGAQRHLSVWQGLQTLPADCQWVAIHDGARPLISADAISACLAAAHQHGAAACAHRITETVKRADASGRVSQSVSRENLWAMETPQTFSRRLIVRAYEHVRASGNAVTDEVSAVEALGEDVYLVDSSGPNPKITFPSDLEWVRRLLISPP